MKEGKITRKDPYDYEKWGLTRISSMICSLGFNEHDKDIKYTRNIFHVLGLENEKEKTKLISGVPFP